MQSRYVGRQLRARSCREAGECAGGASCKCDSASPFGSAVCSSLARTAEKDEKVWNGAHGVVAVASGILTRVGRCFERESGMKKRKKAQNSSQEKGASGASGDSTLSSVGGANSRENAEIRDYLVWHPLKTAYL